MHRVTGQTYGMNIPKVCHERLGWADYGMKVKHTECIKYTYCTHWFCDVHWYGELLTLKWFPFTKSTAVENIRRFSNWDVDYVMGLYFIFLYLKTCWARIYLRIQKIKLGSMLCIVTAQFLRDYVHIGWICSTLFKSSVNIQCYPRCSVLFSMAKSK